MVYYAGQGDSFGQEFLLRLPTNKFASGKECQISVTIPKADSSVAVFKRGQIHSVMPVLLSQEHSRVYSCFNMEDSVVFIYSSSDVFVHVFIEDFYTSLIVYPVDTHGTVYQSTVVKGKETCYPVSVHEDVQAEVYNIASKPITLNENDTFHSPFTFYIEGNFFGGNKAAMLCVITIFTKPSTMFCSNKDYSLVNQPLPVRIWSTIYLIPPQILNLRSVEIAIFTTTGNTNISISNTSHSENFLIQNRNDDVVRKLNATDSPWKVQANFSIMVGLFANDKRLFLLPPVSSYFRNGNFSAIPADVIQNKFSRSEIYNLSVNNDDGSSSSYSFTLLKNDSDKFCFVPGVLILRPQVHILSLVFLNQSKKRSSAPCPLSTYSLQC